MVGKKNIRVHFLSIYIRAGYDRVTENFVRFLDVRVTRKKRPESRETVSQRMLQ